MATTSSTSGSSQKLIHCKVVILGDSGVGKSSIMLRFVTGNYSDNYDPTFGSAFMAKLVPCDNFQVKYQIWDTAGQEKYHSLAHMYYRDAQVAILVYDITNTESFTNLKKWITELNDKGPKDMIYCVVGNKIDLQNEERVTLAEAHSFAKEVNAQLKLTSAKIDKGISEVFDDIAKEMVTRELKAEEKKLTTGKEGGVNLNSGGNKSGKKGCC